jgi:uncharacterized protein
LKTRIERLSLRGPEGNLEALLELEPEVRPRAVALVCHPHPLFGGTMHNKVVFRAAKAAITAGIPALRFNFRGVGESEGVHADGIGEQDDVRAALGYLESRFPLTPVCLMGFSFGSYVALPVGAADPHVVVLVAMGVPLDSSGTDFLHGIDKPKLIVQGTLDQFSSRKEVEIFSASLSEPKQIHFVEGADHFFTNQLDEFQSIITAYLLAQFPIT